MLNQAIENYVHVPNRTNKDLGCTGNVYAGNISYVQMIFEFRFVNTLIFLYFSVLFVTCHFIQKFFPQMQQYYPLKCVSFVQGYSVCIVQSAKVLNGNNP